MDTLLSLATLYQWDETLFDELVLPVGVDKDTLVDNLIIELAELELLYNEPDFLKWAIGRWSTKELKTWEDLYGTTNLSYDPIENYNRNETETLTETRNLTETDIETRDLATTNNETRDLATSVTGATDTTDTDVSSGGDTTTKSETGYNTGSLQTTESVNQSLGSTNTKTVDTDTTQDGTDTGTVDVETTDTGTVTKAMTDSGTVVNEKTSNVKGNIGVTTTQQMINQEREVVKFNIYDYIIDRFKQRFCLMLW